MQSLCIWQVAGMGARPITLWTCALAAVVLLHAVPSAHATEAVTLPAEISAVQEADAITPTTAAQPRSIDLTVRAPHKGASRGAADVEIDVGQLRDVPRRNATDLLKLAAGVMLSNAGGDGHAEQVFLRGFDAREGQDIAFSVAGVPVNESGNLHGNGYADLHFVLPELVRTVRVIEGPFDPRQGNYAVAGSAQYELGLADEGLTVRAGAGSWGARRAVALYRPEGSDAETFAGAELYQTDGFGQNRDSRRGSLMAQLAGNSGESRWRLGTSAYSTRYHTAGVVRADDVLAGRVGQLDTYDYAQGGDVTRVGGWAAWEKGAETLSTRALAWVTWRSGRTRENFTGFLQDGQEPIQKPHGQRGDLMDRSTDVTTVGMDTSARWKFKMLEREQRIDVGLFARVDRADGTAYRIEAATLAPYAKEQDLGSTLGDIGLWLDGDLRLLRWLTLRGGVRADLFTFDVLNRCAVQTVAHPSKTDPPGDASCLTQQAFGHYREPVQQASTSAFAVMPRGSLIVGPWAGTTISLAWGQGVRSIDPQYVTQDVATPFAAATGLDLGVKHTAQWEKLRLNARASLFQTTVDRDLIFSESAGRNTLGGGTTRRGALVDVRATGTHVDQAINATWVQSTFDDTGLLVPYVPDLMVRSETAGRWTLPWLVGGEALESSGALGVTVIGRRPLPQGERADRIVTLDAHLALNWSRWGVALSGTNLLDSAFREAEYTYTSDFHSQPQPTLVPSRHFAAGAPRTWMLTLQMRMGGPA